MTFWGAVEGAVCFRVKERFWNPEGALQSTLVLGLFGMLANAEAKLSVADAVLELEVIAKLLFPNNCGK